MGNTGKLFIGAAIGIIVGALFTIVFFASAFGGVGIGITLGFGAAGGLIASATQKQTNK